MNIDQTSVPFAQLQEMPNQDAGTFEEDDWTHRLHVCFCSQNITSEYTANLRANVSKSRNSRLPGDIGASCLLFRGAPDLIITVDKEDNGIIQTVEMKLIMRDLKIYVRS